MSSTEVARRIADTRTAMIDRFEAGHTVAWVGLSPKVAIVRVLAAVLRGESWRIGEVNYYGDAVRVDWHKKPWRADRVRVEIVNAIAFVDPVAIKPEDSLARREAFYAGLAARKSAR